MDQITSKSALSNGTLIRTPFVNLAATMMKMPITFYCLVMPRQVYGVLYPLAVKSHFSLLAQFHSCWTYRNSNLFNRRNKKLIRAIFLTSKE